MISLCMIVKNEEDNLLKCLSSVSSLVDEIIILDTGSTDKTKEIAFRFTDKIYDYEWDNNFAEARNQSISYAKNDWILVLDADEVVQGFDEEDITTFVNNSSIENIGRIKRFNTIDRNGEIKTYIERVNRLFNKNIYRYNGKVHEQLMRVEKEKRMGSMTAVNIEINHIGYTNEIIKKTNKIERNINLLKEMLKDEPNDIYLLYQLGKSYFMNGNYAEAYNYFKKAIKRTTKNDFFLEYIEDLIESYGYTLINLGKYAEALELEKYEKYYKYKVDFIFLKALIYMNNGKFQKSAELFLDCLEMKEGSIQGVNSYLALYNVGVIFECLGFLNEASEYYKLCGNYEPALKRVKSLSN